MKKQELLALAAFDEHKSLARIDAAYNTSPDDVDAMMFRRERCDAEATENERLLPLIEALIEDREQLYGALEAMATVLPDSIHKSEIEIEIELAARRTLTASDERMARLLRGEGK